MKEIQLTQEKVAFVDDEDYEELSKIKWYAKESSHNKGSWWAEGRIGTRKRRAMHRVILNTDDKIIHINGDKLDNQKSNLISQSEMRVIDWDDPEQRRQWGRDYYSRNKESQQLRNQRSYSKGADTLRANRIYKTYGWTWEQFIEQHENQNWLCAICNLSQEHKRWQKYKQPFLEVDHNHSTGETRKLLCGRCNRKLAVLEDLEFVQKAVKYLIITNSDIPKLGES